LVFRKSSVDTNHPPDETVWHFPTQSEYIAAFHQQEKRYLAIAAMRTGNESELGNIRELLLDWNNVSPHSPDDVMVFDPPLPVIDTNVLSRYQTESPVNAIVVCRCRFRVCLRVRCGSADI
jgi:hypothetical protein